MKTPLLIMLAALLCPALLKAAPPGDPYVRLGEMRRLADGLKYRQGQITLRGGLAKINVPPAFRYLDPADADTVLTKIWPNPPAKTLGMLVPANFDPVYGHDWAVTISYLEDGHVKDDDAATINYDKLLADMKTGVAEASKEREKQGFPSIELIGWAAPPRYDRNTHKLYWAKELKFGGREHELNYSIRMLGRRGILELNVIAGMDQLAAVEKVAPVILATVNFQDGHRYADFNSDTDKVATYGLAALVAGGIAAKAGLLKFLWIGILAAKKFIILGVLAIVSFFKKLFGRKPKTPLVGTIEPPRP